MERHKLPLGGWKCILSPAEIDHSKGVLFLQDRVKDWQRQPNGSAVLRVYPWTPGRHETMEFFIEGLGEAGFSTVNVVKVEGVEVIEKEW